MKRVITILMTLLLSPALVRGSEVEGIVKAMEESYRTLETLEASFLQENRIQGRMKPILSRGRVLLKRPNLIKWVYEVPEGQVILSDGKNLWIYQPSLEQVTTYPVEEEGRMVEDLLSGNLDLFSAFQISLKGEEGDHYYLYLKPKMRRKDMSSITLKVRKGDFMITAISIEDPFGNITKMVFKDIRKNPPLRPGAFILKQGGGKTNGLQER